MCIQLLCLYVYSSYNKQCLVEWFISLTTMLNDQVSSLCGMCPVVVQVIAENVFSPTEVVISKHDST